MDNQVTFEYRESAFLNRIKTFAIVNVEHIDVEDFLSDAFYYFNLEIRENLSSKRIIKVHTSFKSLFSKTTISDDGEEKTEYQTIYINSKTKVVDLSSDLEQFYEQFVKDNILKNIDEVILKGSGFKLSEINELVVQLNEYEPLVGSSYIELPTHLKNKKAIINVKNNDNKCFKYAILSALFPASTKVDRLSKYVQHFNKLNFEGISFPVDIKQISKFEKQNPTISVNVYIYNYESKKVETLRVTKEVKMSHVHLLLIQSDDVSHYCWIKNLSRLLSSQSSKNHRHQFHCDRCLNYFMKKERLEKHYGKCVVQNDCVIEMPTRDNCTIKFENYKNQLRVPFIIYADIETYLKETNEQIFDSEKTKAYQKHEPYSVGYYFKSSYDDSQSYYKSKRGSDCIEWFVRELELIEKDIFPILNSVEPMTISIEEEEMFQTASECHICGEKFNDEDKKVRDHSHISGQYRGPSHQSCNLKYQETRNIPVVFHNLSNYDSHFIISKIASGFEGSISIIPVNDERYISFTKTVNNDDTIEHKKKIQFRFIDSFRFMADSLDKLSSYLTTEKKTILHKESRECGFSSEQIQMLERKGVFPYDYVTSIKILNENSLPPQKAFYNNLNESELSLEEYEFAKGIWNKFNINNLGQYSDLYLKTDVLLLADVFENFRDTCYLNYKLDPAHYFTAAGLSFDAMLKYTKVEIELLTDVDMLMFMEKGIRGGISQCSKRYSKANNKYMNDYDATKESKYLMYLDANNLYGYSMMQHLPLNGFKWSDIEKFKHESTIMNIPHDSSTGYIFEVDLEYPQHLHDHHQDYPLCILSQV